MNICDFILPLIQLNKSNIKAGKARCEKIKEADSQLVKYFTENWPGKKKIIKARFSEEGDTILHLSAKAGTYEFTKFLLSKDLGYEFVNVVDSYHRTALHYICQYSPDTGLIKAMRMARARTDLHDVKGLLAYAAFKENFVITDEIARNLATFNPYDDLKTSRKNLLSRRIDLHIGDDEELVAKISKLMQDTYIRGYDRFDLREGVVIFEDARSKYDMTDNVWFIKNPDGKLPSEQAMDAGFPRAASLCRKFEEYFANCHEHYFLHMSKLNRDVKKQSEYVIKDSDGEQERAEKTREMQGIRLRDSLRLGFLKRTIMAVQGMFAQEQEDATCTKIIVVKYFNNISANIVQLNASFKAENKNIPWSFLNQLFMIAVTQELDCFKDRFYADSARIIGELGGILNLLNEIEDPLEENGPYGETDGTAVDFSTDFPTISYWGGIVGDLASLEKIAKELKFLKEVFSEEIKEYFLGNAVILRSIADIGELTKWTSSTRNLSIWAKNQLQDFPFATLKEFRDYFAKVFTSGRIDVKHVMDNIAKIKFSDDLKRFFLDENLLGQINRLIIRIKANQVTKEEWLSSEELVKPIMISDSIRNEVEALIQRVVDRFNADISSLENQNVATKSAAKKREKELSSLRGKLQKIHDLDEYFKKSDFSEASKLQTFLTFLENNEGREIAKKLSDAIKNPSSKIDLAISGLTDALKKPGEDNVKSDKKQVALGFYSGIERLLVRHPELIEERKKGAPVQSKGFQEAQSVFVGSEIVRRKIFFLYSSIYFMIESKFTDHQARVKFDHQNYFDDCLQENAGVGAGGRRGVGVHEKNFAYFWDQIPILQKRLADFLEAAPQAAATTSTHFRNMAKNSANSGISR